MKKEIVISIIIYFLFGLELIWLFNTLNVCPFERNVDEIRADLFDDATEQYEYSIEDLSIDEEDILRLVNISGWIIKLGEDGAEPVQAEIILDTMDKSYKLKTYLRRRTDLYQLGQVDPKTGNLDAGFYGKYPEKCFTKGNYKLGFLFKEDGKMVILWSDRILEL